jgi:hypothetical protein
MTEAARKQSNYLYNKDLQTETAGAYEYAWRMWVAWDQQGRPERKEWMPVWDGLWLQWDTAGRPKEWDWAMAGGEPVAE